MKLLSTSVMASAFKLLLLAAVTSVLSFTSTRRTSTNFATSLFSAKPQTYAELLQASKIAKQQQKGGAVPTRVAPPAAPVASKTPSPTEAPIKYRQDELPFDDAIYDHLKLVIGTLSARMKSDTPLTAEKLEQFRSSCSEIIRDAKQLTGDAPITATPTTAVQEGVFSTPEPEDVGKRVEARRNGKDVVHKALPVKKYVANNKEFVIHQAGEGPASEEKPDPNSPYSDLHGLSNTWQIAGMDNMTTEEYYAAINKRILDMKDKRRSTEGSSNTMVNDYFESLSKPRKSE